MEIRVESLRHQWWRDVYYLAQYFPGNIRASGFLMAWRIYCSRLIKIKKRPSLFTILRILAEEGFIKTLPDSRGEMEIERPEVDHLSRRRFPSLTIVEFWQGESPELKILAITVRGLFDPFCKKMSANRPIKLP